jgi:hypothetical protein
MLDNFPAVRAGCSFLFSPGVVGMHVEGTGNVAGKRMKASVLLRVGLGLAVGAVALAVSTQAWANSTININHGNVPTTAAGYGNHDCDANQGGGPFQGKDVWVFVLPGNHKDTGDFVSVTATFGANGSITITSAANPQNFANSGSAAAKAWIVTPAGWTLTGATAVITGTADKFNLTHTCPAAGSPGPSPSPSPSSPGDGSPSPSPSTPDGSTPPPGGSSPPGSGTPGGPGGTTPNGGAPTGGGGAQPTGSLLLGLGALVLAAGSGVTLVLAWRRRGNA